ncbi:DUF3566 domain-containing protein [Pseudonocardia sp. TRM90224]|uniref:DUF3566 domain-containing protein n=1 Tax=Pseudonocardia sp. TRM90224 TaxID=2812678 RepID=UPI0027DEB9FB|nr:DUF3566 domain-containing protein [Pseudonocardia sp. TRM90224]
MPEQQAAPHRDGTNGTSGMTGPTAGAEQPAPAAAAEQQQAEQQQAEQQAQGQAEAPVASPPASPPAPPQVPAQSAPAGPVAAEQPAAAEPVPDETKTAVDMPAVDAATTVVDPNRPPPEEAPTARIRLHTAGNGKQNPSAYAPVGSDDATRPVDPAILAAAARQAAASSRMATPPEPAPGPVPGPGPEAAPPPPWSRMPGQDAPHEQTQPAAAPQPQTPPPPPPAQPQHSPGPVGGLLDTEGPTTFLEAPPQHPGFAGAEHSEPTTEQGTGRTTVRAVRNRAPRQAALQLKRLDPWAVMKLGLVLAVVLFLVWMVAVGVLYGALDGMGVWGRLNGGYAELLSSGAVSGEPLITAGRVFGLAAVVGAINSLLFAVAMTVGAFVYNVSSDLVGGIEVTLSERD